MQQSPPPWRAARYALRHPGFALRLATADRVRTAAVLVQAVPAPVRRRLLGAVIRLTAASLGRPGGHDVAGPVAVFALRARGDRGAALAVAEAQVGRAGVRGAARLARLALALGAPMLAQRLVDAAAGAGARVDPVLAAEVAEARGRYRDSLAMLDRDPGLETHGAGRGLARRVRSEMALVADGWAPRLGSGEGPGDRVRAGQAGTILHVLTNSLPQRQGGYTLRAQAVGRCQQAVGLQPHFATRAGFPASEGIAAEESEVVVDGVPYHRIRPELPFDTPLGEIAEQTARGLLALADRLRPALLQPTSNYVNGKAALAVGARLGLPVVYEARGFLEETWLAGIDDPDAEQADLYLGRRAAETWCMRHADAVVTLSETMRRAITERGIDPDRVVVVPNAVDLERFTPGPRDEALAALLGIAADETVIGYVSSLTPYEGIAYLIDAAAMLVSEGRRVRLLVVGEGVERAALIARARERGLLEAGTAIFPGNVAHAEVARYYRLIDVFVIPRTRDRVSRLVTPLKPYEAMAMAKAMVVSDVEALVEIVEDGRTGIVAPPEDAAGLAAAIEPLVDDPDERARLGSAARAWVAEHRTWTANGQRYLELYRRLGAA